MTITDREAFIIELLRMKPGALEMLIDWADELEVVHNMSDWALRNYTPTWIDGYEEVAEHYNNAITCEMCERKTVEPDINNVDCCGCMDTNCPMCDEVSYALRPYVLADMMLRGIWGYNDRT